MELKVPSRTARGRIVALPKPRRGMSLVEVLMALLLFSVALIGLVGLQARAVQISVSGENSQRASLLASELATTMWTTGTVNLPAATLTAWNNQVADPTGRGVPNGVGAVAVTGTVARITITWRAPHEPSTTTHQYYTEVQL
jgi:type IV pilus assembly protein PilV